MKTAALLKALARIAFRAGQANPKLVFDQWWKEALEDKP